jgi:biotin operon repressor
VIPATVRLKPECSSGWFAAGTMMSQALSHLSDGAFKLFVYLCLHASRQSGSLSLSQAGLASALGKSRRSIGLYLTELEQKGCCQIQPRRNQHAQGSLTIADPYWPYQRSQPPNDSSAQSAFVAEVKRMFLERVPGAASFTAADQQLACRWFVQQVSLDRLEKAFLLGSVRQQITRINRQENTPIRSLHYFQPLLEEVRRLKVSHSYWVHLRHQLHRLTQSSPAAGSSSARKLELTPPPLPQESRQC